jgi:hypothetical protein
MTTNEAHLKCIRNGLKVYAEVYGYTWKICYALNGKITVFDKKLRTNKEINTALEKTLIHLANKL